MNESDARLDIFRSRYSQAIFFGLVDGVIGWVDGVIGWLDGVTRR